ncbi:MAG: hypothetical protein IID41_09015 [Planctomycetes bacterium]|nr:hypothetical protein [Planctomycetota bacterium]
MRQRTPGCPDCGCERDMHFEPELQLYANGSLVTCEDCGECDRVFDPGDEIDAAMMRAEEAQNG